ncbi:MAG: hypothetical protein OJF50_004456 [Nitrospira sp.]|jgi:hypothetical protein|nr:hypothetical protein [Nitrospira sp.]
MARGIYMGPMQSSQISHVFTLIHGTWSNSFLFKLPSSHKPQWFEDGSRFRHRLLAAFPSSLFNPFHWSGGNSVYAREEAAKGLVTNLTKLTIDYPNAEHFIIAHSHGGNVACYALRDQPELSNSIRGIICLSTPFLYVKRRADSRYIFHVLMALPIFGLFLTAAHFNLLTFAGLDPVVWDASRSFILDNFVPNASFLAGLSWLLAFGLVRWLDRMAASVEQTMKTPSPILIPLLLVRTAADEASIALTLFQVANWIMSKLLASIIWPASTARRLQENHKWVKWLRWSIFLVPLLFMIYVDFNIDPLESIFMGIFLGSMTILGLPIIFPSLITFLMSALIGPFLLIIYIIASLAISGFIGPRFAFAHIFLSVITEASPLGNHTICQFGFQSDLKEPVRGRLSHSLTYEATEILDNITEWVRNITLSPKMGR